MSMQEILTEKLSNAFAPEYLSIDNESYRHNVPAGSESHFKVIIIADTFAGLSLLERHKAVFETLSDEMKSIHALSVNAYTVAEWQSRGGKVADSPNCRGGSLHDKDKS